MPTFSFRLLALVSLAAPGIASAQNSSTPVLVPGLERFDLGPRPQATPTPTPTPSATSTPAPAPRPTPTRATVVRPISTPKPAATPVPAPDLTPTPPQPTPTPIATAAPAPIETLPTTGSMPAPSSVAIAPLTASSPAATAAPTEVPGTAIWPILLGGLATLLAIGAALAYRRRRAAADRFTLDVDEIASPVPDAPLPPARPLPDMPDADDFPPASPRQPDAPPSPAPVFLAETPHAAARADLDVIVRPIRAGTNLTSAAVDYEIDIRNSGDVDATGIRLDLRLLSASADQDAILSALYAAPIDQPIVAPFDIAAGDQVSLGGMAMLPRDLLTIMSAQGRDFFVPLLSVNVVYGWGDGATGQTARAHVIGIERNAQGGGKMAPFRLDTGPRMYDNVDARPHLAGVKR